MLNRIKSEFEKVRLQKKAAEQLLKDSLPVGSEIVFHKGNMRTNANAEVLCVTGSRVRVRVVYSKAIRWIELSDIQGI